MRLEGKTAIITGASNGMGSSESKLFAKEGANVVLADIDPEAGEQLVEEILETPEKELRELSYEDLERRLAATIACHAAIKINTPLDPTKIQWLLDELGKTDYPMACPHGRPVALEYTMKGILRAFHRI